MEQLLPSSSAQRPSPPRAALSRAAAAVPEHPGSAPPSRQPWHPRQLPASRRVGAPAFQPPQHWTAPSLPSYPFYFRLVLRHKLCSPLSPARPPPPYSGHKQALLDSAPLRSPHRDGAAVPASPGDKRLSFPHPGGRGGLSPLPLSRPPGASESRISGRLPLPPFASRLRDFQLFPLLSSRLSARLPACLLFYFPRQ